MFQFGNPVFIFVIAGFCASAVRTLQAAFSDADEVSASVINDRPLDGRDASVIDLEAVDPERAAKNLAFLVVSITRTYRVTSVTTTPVTSIARCYKPTTIAICSKKKRELLVIPGPPDADAEMDAYANDIRLQSIDLMDKGPGVDAEPPPVELDGSVELLDEDTIRTVAEARFGANEYNDDDGMFRAPGRRRGGRLFRPQSYVSSTTLTTTSTYTSTLWGSTIETVIYVNCRAPTDPIAPACSGP